MIELSIVIPTYNRCEPLRRCLEALARQTQPADTFEVIVVVDGSTDGTREFLAGFAAPFKLTGLWQDRRRQAAARNLGAGQAVGRTCLFLDDDIVPAPGLVAAHQRAQAAGLGVIGVGRLIAVPRPNADWYEAASDRAWDAHYARLSERTPTWRACYTGNLSVPRAAFLAASGFDTRMPVEDTELGYRLVQAGWPVVYLPEAVGEHAEAKDTRRRLAEAERLGRGYVAFWRKHPRALAELFGPFDDNPYRARLLRRLLLKLNVPAHWLLGLRWASGRADWAAWCYDFLRQYAYWRGVRHGLADEDLWHRLTDGVRILMYHALGRPGEPASRFILPARQFAAQLRWLKRLGYRFIDLGHYLEQRAAGQLPERNAVILTLDDGYQDNVDLGLPILRDVGAPATVFLVSQRVGGVNDWDTAGEVVGRPLADWAAWRAWLAAGLAIGAHTRTHPRLTELPPAEAQAEIAGSGADLADALGRRSTLFAYPYGQHDAGHEAAAAAAGYQGVLSVIDGPNYPATRPTELRRMEVSGHWSLPYFLRAVWRGYGRM